MSTLDSIKSYGLGFQTKVISSLLTRKKFLQSINDVIEIDFFDSQATKWIVEYTLKYHRKYNCPPSIDILHIEVKKIENDILQIAVVEQLKESYNSSSDSDLEYVEEEFSNFCKNQKLKQALLSSVDLLNESKYDSIKIIINNALKAGQDKNIGHEYEKDIESRFRDDTRKAIPTPWSELNELTQGGLGSGDLGIIFGNPGGGKSWTLVALGAHALSLGYNVIHYTLELGEDYVGKRYDAYNTKIPFTRLSKLNRKEVELAISKNLGKLIIKEYSPKRASIFTIENHIHKCIDLEFKPDLILIDYIDLLSSPKKNLDDKGEIDDIYINTKGLAKEINMPIWSVSQVNRDGSRDSVIEGNKSAGSYNKIMISDIVFSLSRLRKDKLEGTGRFHVMKNRYGSDGITYNIGIDTDTGHIEILDEFDEEQEASFNKDSEEKEKSYLRNKFKEFSKK